MRAEGTFKVTDFQPAVTEPAHVDLETNSKMSVYLMVKEYQGEVSGQSSTIFTSVLDAQENKAGGYVAAESFSGRLGDLVGGFNYIHMACTTGADRFGDHLMIVPSSGAGELAGISGSGGMAIDADGTHRIWFDYELPQA